MKIIGIEGLSDAQLNAELQQGARFVVYQYCISVLVMTFRRSSDVYFITANDNSLVKGLGFSLLSFLLGWWGIPWGPIYTINSLWINFRGGRDVTQAVLASFQQPIQAPKT